MIFKGRISGLRATCSMRMLDLRPSLTPTLMGRVFARRGKLTKRAVESAIRAESKEKGGSMASDCRSAGSRLRQSRGSAAGSGRSSKACSRESRAGAEAALGFSMGG